MAAPSDIDDIHYWWTIFKNEAQRDGSKTWPAIKHMFPRGFVRSWPPQWREALIGTLAKSDAFRRWWFTTRQPTDEARKACDEGKQKARHEERRKNQPSTSMEVREYNRNKRVRALEDKERAARRQRRYEDEDEDWTIGAIFRRRMPSLRL